MPVVSPTTLISLIEQNTTSAATNGTSNALQVICAWPVSGQYGPGSRVLYYALIAACLFARKAEWLRSACLAAALLFPAVAALHGIVLAAVHVNGAVDMDVYGAFQLCSIGILAAPVTVRLSKTYFYDPGRNIIFLWTSLILAGLLSLTVEFFRINPSKCTHDDFGNPVSFSIANFTYATNCGLTCSVNDPESPLRRGSANNIYVIPAPDKFTFDTATLLAAACCVPAILSLVFMWNKILEINWKASSGDQSQDEQPIEGTNGATPREMQGVNKLIRMFLNAVEIPVFGAAVLTILILGERNFFSHQVNYQTEPIATIGQWAPIAGTVLAALGSFYVLVATNMEAVKEDSVSENSTHHCTCSMHEVPNHQRTPSIHSMHRRASSIHSMVSPTAMQMRHSFSNDWGGAPSVIAPSVTQSTLAQSHRGRRSFIADSGSRRKVAEALIALDNYVNTAAHDMFNDSEFRHGKANDFPEIPGEEHRNKDLPQIKKQYNANKDADGNATPLRRQSSRAGSFTSVVSGLGIEGISTTSAGESSQPSQFPFPSSTTTNVKRSSTLPTEQRKSIEVPTPEMSPSEIPPLRKRAETLEVPPMTYHTPPLRGNATSSLIVAAAEGQSSPAIVISPDPGTSSFTDRTPLAEPLSPPPQSYNNPS